MATDLVGADGPKVDEAKERASADEKSCEQAQEPDCRWSTPQRMKTMNQVPTCLLADRPRTIGEIHIHAMRRELALHLVHLGSVSVQTAVSA